MDKTKGCSFDIALSVIRQGKFVYGARQDELISQLWRSYNALLQKQVWQKFSASYFISKLSLMLSTFNFLSLLLCFGEKVAGRIINKIVSRAELTEMILKISLRNQPLTMKAMYRKWVDDIINSCFRPMSRGADSITMKEGISSLKGRSESQISHYRIDQGQCSVIVCSSYVSLYPCPADMCEWYESWLRKEMEVMGLFLTSRRMSKILARLRSDEDQSMSVWYFPLYSEKERRLVLTDQNASAIFILLSQAYTRAA